jgi:hypothetical protein
MHDREERPISKLTIDPQPRQDLKVPPMVQTRQPQGVSSTMPVAPKRQEMENLFVGLDFTKRT